MSKRETCLCCKTHKARRGKKICRKCDRKIVKAIKTASWFNERATVK